LWIPNSYQGGLDLMLGLLNSRDKVLAIGADAMKMPDAIRGMRNLLIPGQVICSVEPELMKKFAGAIPDALATAASAERAEPSGFFGVLAIFRSKELRRGLAVVNGLLESWGRNFSKS
jgi:uncharacterized protein YjgD (DUF1641 family)